MLGWREMDVEGGKLKLWVKVKEGLLKQLKAVDCKALAVRVGEEWDLVVALVVVREAKSEQQGQEGLVGEVVMDAGGVLTPQLRVAMAGWWLGLQLEWEGCRRVAC